jgi:uncharacterized membrane protein AbrB (regulator of aidB expression)
MNCPHCQQPLPEQTETTSCPHCGREWKTAAPDVAEKLPRAKISWKWFWLAFLAPPLLTMAVACYCGLMLPTRGENDGPLPPLVALLGSVAGGLACGNIIALKQSESATGRVGVTLVCGVVFFFVCLILCFFGCSIGGYQLNIH